MYLSSELPIKKAENIELLVDNTRKQYKFGDIENLRGKHIRMIDAYRAADVPVTPLGNVNVSDTIFNKAFLVLSVDGKEVINRLPLTAICPKDNLGRRQLFNDLLINWPKSYIELGDTTGVVVGTSFYLIVYYEDQAFVKK